MFLEYPAGIDSRYQIPLIKATNNNLEFVGFVIMVVQCFKHVAFSGDSKLGWISDSFAQGLSGIFLNLKIMS